MNRNDNFSARSFHALSTGKQSVGERSGATRSIAALTALLAMVPVASMAEARTLTERSICGNGTSAQTSSRSLPGEKIERQNKSADVCLLLGAGLQGGQSEYLSEDLSKVLPAVYLRYGNFFWDTTQIGYYVAGKESTDGYWGIAALLELPSNGFEVSDEAHLVNLDDREPTLEGGLSLITGGSWGDLELKFNVDLEDEHEGYSAYASYGYPLQTGRLTLAPQISWQYKDEKNGNYYYGVNADESGPAGRKAYAIDKPVTTLGLGYSMSYMLSSHWSMFHSLEARFLDDALKDSPLTLNEKPVAANFGVLIRFL